MFSNYKMWQKLKMLRRLTAENEGLMFVQRYPSYFDAHEVIATACNRDLINVIFLQLQLFCPSVFEKELSNPTG